MDVYSTLRVEDSEAIEEILAQGDVSIVQIGLEWYPVIRVDTETNLVEIGSPAELTYHGGSHEIPLHY